jgi:hypothetical protein
MVELNRQLAAICATGTQSVRFPIYWSTAQPYASWAEVPRASRGRPREGGAKNSISEVLPWST